VIYTLSAKPKEHNYVVEIEHYFGMQLQIFIVP